MKITFHGHSCIQIETEQHSIIIDPFLNGNPVATVKADEIRVQYILLTHGHNDHVGDAEKIAKQNDATIIAPFELAEYLGWKGCKVHPLSIGGSWNFDFGRVKLTPAFHSSGYTIDEEHRIIYMGMPAGILLTLNGKTLFHAGDTGLFGDMKLIGELNQIDLAFLPIGDNYTMGPEDALIAAEWLQAKRVMPIHFNTIPLLKQDGELFIEQLKEKGIEGFLLQAGEQLEM